LVPPLPVFPTLFGKKEKGKKEDRFRYRYRWICFTIVPRTRCYARARMLECHHALIMFVVLCGRCRRRGANLGDALLRRLIPVLQVDPPTLSPCAHPCMGPHASTRSYSMLGWTRCYGDRVGKTCVPA